MKIIKLKNKNSARECDIVKINPYDEAESKLTMNEPGQAVKEWESILLIEIEYRKGV